MTWRPLAWWAAISVVAIAAPSWFEVAVVFLVGAVLRPREDRTR